MSAPLLSVELDHANTEELMVRAQANAAMYAKRAEWALTDVDRAACTESADFWQHIAHRCVVTLRQNLEVAA